MNIAVVVLLLFLLHHQVSGYTSFRHKRKKRGSEHAKGENTTGVNRSEQAYKRHKKRRKHASPSNTNKNKLMPRYASTEASPSQLTGGNKMKPDEKKKGMPWKQFHEEHGKNPNYFAYTKPKQTPSPTPSPTTPVNTRTIDTSVPLVSLYFVAWIGARDDFCDIPQPGLSIACGSGGNIVALNSTSNAQCVPSGGEALSCHATFDDVDFLAAVVYGCIGTTEEQWTTQVDAIPDMDVQCSFGGAAGTRIFLSQRCPGTDDDDFNLVQCRPPSALGTDENGFNNCLTFDECSTATCNLSTPPVGSAIGVDAISRDCLFDDDGTFTPPPTPQPLQQSRYLAALLSFTDVAFTCGIPQPGLLISCGFGNTIFKGEIELINSSSNIQCTPVGAGALSCDASFDEIDTFALVAYACVGSSVGAWTTRVDAVSGTSVQCSENGVALTGILLGQGCPDELDFCQVRCNRGSTFEGEESFGGCFATQVCNDTACTLDTPTAGARIGRRRISRECITDVDGGISTPPPTPPTAMSARYQAEWFGVTSEAELCEDPTPTVVISCGVGGVISILDTTNVTTCETLINREEIVCVGTPSEEGFWGVLYSCRGDTFSAWTTRADAIPDPRVPCQGGGAAGTRILIGKRCNSVDSVDYGDIECDPVDAFSVADSGRDSCLTFDICLEETCDLATLPVSGFISEDSISQECLQP